MEFIIDYLLFVTTLCLIAVVVKLHVDHTTDRDWLIENAQKERWELIRGFDKERQALLDRLMSKSFVEYKDHTELEPNEEDTPDPDVIDLTDAREDLEQTSTEDY